MSEKDREVLGALHLPDSFPSTAFRSFDHQGKTNPFCCLGGKGQRELFRGETFSTATGTVGRFWVPQALRLPPSLPLRLSHNPGGKCPPGHRLLSPAAGRLLPIPPSDLESQRTLSSPRMADTHNTENHGVPSPKRLQARPLAQQGADTALQLN